MSVRGKWKRYRYRGRSARVPVTGSPSRRERDREPRARGSDPWRESPERRRRPCETFATAAETSLREPATVTETLEPVRRREGGRRNVSRDKSSGPGDKDSDPWGSTVEGGRLERQVWGSRRSSLRGSTPSLARQKFRPRRRRFRPLGSDRQRWGGWRCVLGGLTFRAGRLKLRPPRLDAEGREVERQ